MKVLLFGGTFDPPHLAHTEMVRQILGQGYFDEVWYVPVGHQHTKFFDTKKMADISHRLAMLQLVLIPGVKINQFEVNSGKPSHTDLTLKSLQRQFPQHQFSFLIGSDQLAKLYLWLTEKETPTFPTIFNDFDFYVYPRVGYEMNLPYPQLKIITGVEPMPDSSTEIRKRIKAGDSITGLVDPKVEQYIADHQLYR